jgi:hypothetical protein
MVTTRKAEIRRLWPYPTVALVAILTVAIGRELSDEPALRYLFAALVLTITTAVLLVKVERLGFSGTAKAPAPVIVAMEAPLGRPSGIETRLLRPAELGLATMQARSLGRGISPPRQRAALTRDGAPVTVCACAAGEDLVVEASADIEGPEFIRVEFPQLRLVYLLLPRREYGRAGRARIPSLARDFAEQEVTVAWFADAGGLAVEEADMVAHSIRYGDAKPFEWRRSVEQLPPDNAVVAAVLADLATR